MSASYAPFAVCVWPDPLLNAPRSTRYGAYIYELLGHDGIAYQAIAVGELNAAFDDLRLLLTVGEYALPEPLKTNLRNWIYNGGIWISISGICGLDDACGATLAKPAFSSWGGGLCPLGEGYLDVQETHPVLHGIEKPLHFFGGLKVETNGARVLASALDAHGQSIANPTLLEHQFGAGTCLFIAPDVTGSIVQIQQGRAVTRDGISAPDGTAPLDDGVLKSDDGQVLDWHFDRDEVPHLLGLHAFLRPIADQWRGIVRRAIFYAAQHQKICLPVLWYYPEKLPALGHISHDSDHNNPQQALRLLEVLATAKIASTWCIILPGYNKKLLAQIEASGHELAMHFDALEGPHLWNEATFDAQWQELQTLLGTAPTTNKNHYLRWQGDTEFFEWCCACGITMEQSKGASKTGEAGFNFGTCHPYRPLTLSGEVLPILELPTPTQDLEIFAPATLSKPLLKAVLEQHGILHLLFHPAHIEKLGVAESLLDIVNEGKKYGLQWWTAREIANWENARRAAQWQWHNGWNLMCQQALQNATILQLNFDGNSHFSFDGFFFDASVRIINDGENIKMELL